MENKELLTKYELVVILDAKLNPEEKEGIINDVLETVKKQDCKVINNKVWIEKQKLAFEIKKCKDGTYYLINFEGKASASSSIRGSLRLKEKLLRFSIIKAETK